MSSERIPANRRRWRGAGPASPTLARHRAAVFRLQESAEQFPREDLQQILIIRIGLVISQPLRKLWTSIKHPNVIYALLDTAPGG